MPKATRSVEEVDAVRCQILDYTFKIIEKNGYEGLSMAKIASLMKMTAANLYNYFASKDELLIAIHKKAYAMLYDKISYVVEMADTPLQRYKSMAYAFVDFGTNNPNIYDIMFNRPVRQFSDYVGTPLETQSSDEFRSSLKVYFLAIKVIREYRESKPELEPIDPQILTIQSISALHGIISLHNSGVFYQITDDPEMKLNAMIDRAIACVIG